MRFTRHTKVVKGETPLLSVLVSGVMDPSNRWEKTWDLLNLQHSLYSCDVELLILVDSGFDYSIRPLDRHADEKNSTRTLGYNRQLLLGAAKGLYVSYVDAGDRVTGTYLNRLVEACGNEPLLITFDILVNDTTMMTEGQIDPIVMKHGSPDPDFLPEHSRCYRYRGSDWSRTERGKRRVNPDHRCVWKKRLADQYPWQIRLGRACSILRSKAMEAVTGHSVWDREENEVEIPEVLYIRDYGFNPDIDKEAHDLERSQQYFKQYHYPKRWLGELPDLYL